MVANTANTANSTNETTGRRPSERLIQAEIMAAFAAGGRLARVAKVWRINVGTFLTQDGRRLVHTAPVGFPDLLGRIIVRDRGRMLHIECKRPGCITTPEQTAFIRTANAEGALAIVATSVEDVVRALRAEGYGDYLR